MSDTQPIPDTDLTALTPARLEEVTASLTEQYNKDWGGLVAGLEANLAIARTEVFAYLMCRELAMIRNSMEVLIGDVRKLRQPVYHDDCAGCREAKRFHELQLEMMELTIRHLKEEHGDEWKGEP